MLHEISGAHPGAADIWQYHLVPSIRMGVVFGCNICATGAAIVPDLYFLHFSARCGRERGCKFSPPAIPLQPFPPCQRLLIALAWPSFFPKAGVDAFWCFLHGVATAHSASVALLAARPSVKFFTLVWSHMYVSLYHPMNTINRMCQEAAERQNAIRRSDLPKGSSALACCGSSWSCIHDQFMSAWQLLWKASETAEVKLVARSLQL